MKKFLLIGSLVLMLVNCTKVIDGFQDKISYSQGETLEVYLNATGKTNKNIELLDINGNVVDEVKADVFEQPEVDTSSWYETGYLYQKTFSYNTNKLKSGIYHFENSSPFVVKNPAKTNDVVVVYPSNTINAYNENGGRSTYTRPIGYSLSMRRPTNDFSESSEFFKWIPSQSVNVDYICDKDLDDYTNFSNYKVLIVTGHSEYWSRIGRRNFDKFVAKGGHAIVLSGNTMWKQVRYEGDNVICYNNFYDDSLYVDSLRTSCFCLKQLNYPINESIGANFVEGGYGKKEDDGWDGYKIISNSPLFEGTGIKTGDVLSIPSREYDGAPVLYVDGEPILDTSRMKFHKQQLIGYDKGFRIKETTGTFIVFQKTKTSGVIINTATTNWCSSAFTEKDGDKIKKLTFNFIDFLLKGKEVFN